MTCDSTQGEASMTRLRLAFKARNQTGTRLFSRNLNLNLKDLRTDDLDLDSDNGV